MKPTRSPLFIGLITGSIALLVYGLTLAPDLTWANHSGDGPELITAALTLGVPHPPGYPIYTMLGYLFAQLPIGTAAFRFNLFSAAGMAVAAGFTAVGSWQVLHLTQRRRGAEERHRLTLGWYMPIAVGLTFAFAPLVWSQATVAEVYGLHMAFLAATLWALWQPRPHPWLCGGLLGLTITTHLTAWLWLPLALVLVKPRHWLALGGGLLLGLTPFLALPWLAQSDGPLVWGRPDTWAGWWWVVSARIYHPNLLAHGWVYSGQQAWHLLGLLTIQFTPVGLLLIGYGLNLTGWQSQIAQNLSGLREKWGWLVLGGTAVIYFLYASLYHTPDYHIFILPALLPLAYLITPALHDLWHRSTLRLPPMLPLLLPLLLLLLHFPQQNLRQDTAVRPAAIALLEASPLEAILLTPGDQTISTLWYFQVAEGVRPDLVLVDHNLFGFDWYRERLGRTYPFLTALDQGDPAIFAKMNEGKRPFCHVGFSETIDPIIQCSR